MSFPLIKNILFDLDGTLLDPKEGILGCLQEVHRELGYPVPSFRDLYWTIGPTLWESLPALLKTTDTDLIKKGVQIYRRLYDDEGGWKKNEIYEGIPTLLNQLTQKSFTLFIATGKPHPIARRIIEEFKFARFFKNVYGAEFDGTRRNKADLLTYLLEKENLKPQETIMIGDRKHDVIAAKENGLQSIGVRYGYSEPHELEKAQADAICQTPKDIGTLFGL